MDSNEPTAWEEIDPPMALAARPAPRSTFSDLAPATPTEFRNELTSCLALVAPTGMAEDDRREWLRVAWGTLGHLPADLLARGCRKARETCDHPSKVVPAIMAETEEPMRVRRRLATPEPQRRLEPPKRHIMDRRGEPMTAAETEELNKILTNLGATTRYREDGSRHAVEAESIGRRDNRGPPRKPTRQDYIEMGVDPAVLDAGGNTVAREG